MWWVKGEPPYAVNTNGILNESTTLKDDTMTEGYIYVNPSPITQGLGWLDKYYLYCVPLKQITMNPALNQNPGWPTTETAE